MAKPLQDTAIRSHKRNTSAFASLCSQSIASIANLVFQRNFYLTLAAIPLGFALYKFTADSKEGPSFTRLIERYSEYKEQWTARNTLHTTMIEQAAHDRNLFQSSPGSKMIDLKFPEYVLGTASEMVIEDNANGN
jgi:hypothetical protein